MPANLHQNLEILNDFLTVEHHDMLLSKVKDTVFELKTQTRPNHFSHVFASNSPHITRKNESYEARFMQADSQILTDPILESFFHSTCTALKNRFPNLRYFQRPIVSKLVPGCFYRMHVDDYAGDCGYTFFLNQGWMWDYGGILRFYDQSSLDSVSIFPKSNTLLVRDESVKLFHDVSLIADHSKLPQYLILGWASCSIAGNPKYEYVEI